MKLFDELKILKKTRKTSPINPKSHNYTKSLSIRKKNLEKS